MLITVLSAVSSFLLMSKSNKQVIDDTTGPKRQYLAYLNSA